MIYEILLHSKYGGFQRELWSMVYRIFVKKIRSGANFNRYVEYLLAYKINLNVKQINYGLIKENSFIITLSKNG